MRRVVIALVTLAIALVATAATAFGHAIPLSATPEPGSILVQSPSQVTVTFNEPVQLLRPDDFVVVNSAGAGVTSTPAAVAADRRVIEVGLRPNLPDGTYTARYQVIGADSHVIPSLFVFGVGVDKVGLPYLGGEQGGPSETSAWGVSARYAEIITLGGLLGLIAFRWLVWGVVWRRGPSVTSSERDALLTWWRDDFWLIFGVLALAAMLAQGYALLVQGASVLGISVWETLRNSSGLSEVLGQTEFGTLVQLRGALLFALFAVGAIQFMREYGNGRSPTPVTATGGPVSAALMAALVLSVLGSIAWQGHARVAEVQWLQVGAQIVHTAGAAVWITGLVLVVLVFGRVPRLAPEGGSAIAARVLMTFSLVATCCIVLVIATGVVRSFGELAAPAELWQTGYGRSILYKIALLVPLTGIAMYNRRVVAALRTVHTPTRATLRLVRRTASAELALSLGIVFIATILVAQVPGG